MAKRKTEKEKREENIKKSAKKLKKNHKKLYFTLLAIVVLIVLALFLVDRFYMPLEDLYKKIFKKETAQTAASGEGDGADRCFRRKRFKGALCRRWPGRRDNYTAARRQKYDY